MAKNHFLAGPGRVLMLDGNDLFAVANTLNNTSLNFTVASEEVRGGQGNPIWGKYFHDSNLAVSMTNIMFDLKQVAANLGANVTKGGLSIKEEQVTATMSGKVSVTETPVAFNGTMIGWYKKPTETEWQIGTLSGKDMTISAAKERDIYCVKYFYNNENAESITIKTQYIPKILHIIMINDLFAGDVEDIGSAEKYGRLITDIPRLQLEGAMDLSLSSASAATVPLSGNALAVNPGDSCETETYYGTMTQEIYGAKWQNDVVALAVENGDVEIGPGETETLVVRAVFGAGMGAQRKDNSNFTFAIEEAPASTASDTRVDPETGVITGGSTPGSCVISATLKGAPAGVKPAYILVTATGA